MLKSLVEKGGAKCGNEVCVEPLCGAERRCVRCGNEVCGEPHCGARRRFLRCGMEVCDEPLCGAGRRCLPAVAGRIPSVGWGLGGGRCDGPRRYAGEALQTPEVGDFFVAPADRASGEGAGGRWRSTVVWGPASINDRRSPKAPV